jgi:hypothetical protein
MNNSVPPRERILALGSVPVVLDVAAQWVAGVASSEPFLLSINDGPEFGFSSGMIISQPSAEITRLRVSRAPGWVVASNAVTLLYGVGSFADNRLTVSAGLSIASGQVIGQAAAATLSGAIADITLVAATNTQIFAANAAARCRRVRNTSLSASVRLSTTAADLTAGRGEYLDAGEVGEFFVNGVIFARSAGTPTLVLTEEIY